MSSTQMSKEQPAPQGRSYSSWSSFNDPDIVARERGRTPEDAAKDAATYMTMTGAAQ